MQNTFRAVCFFFALALTNSIVLGGTDMAKANDVFLKGLEAYADKKFTDAINLYTVATSFGHLGAPSFIGHIYVDGEGVPQNFILAYMWYEIGAARGFQDSRENRDRIAKMMEKKSIEEAQKKAKICIKSEYKNCK